MKGEHHPACPGPRSVTQHNRITVPPTTRWMTTNEVVSETGINRGLARHYVERYGRLICGLMVISHDRLEELLNEQGAETGIG